MMSTGSPAGARGSHLTGLPGGVARMVPWRISEEAVIGGAPRLRGRILSESHDRRVTAGVCECDACRLDVTVEGDELLVVLEGRLVIQTGQGETLLLETGDVACLPDGVGCVVTVPERCRCAFQAALPAA